MLEDLLWWRGEPAALVRALGVAGEGTETAVFGRGHALAAVRRVVRGAAEAGELIAWAQAVHFEEAVDLEEGQEDLLTRFLVEMSTPELFGAVTADTCRRWVNVLSGGLTEEMR